MSTSNRKYKDSVFVDLFSEDEKAKENFLSLYNALHGTSLTAADALKNIRLDQVLYMTFYNDVSYLVENKIIVLAEHQSTINPNMPLRCLEYISRLYETFFESKEKYSRKLLNIPTPEFYVFYNGEEPFPSDKTLKLSEAFIESTEKPNLELTVKVININRNNRHPILENCKTMQEYTVFVETVRRWKKTDSQNGFQKAIEECIQNNILRDYLKRKTKEVINMLLAEYDYETDIAVQRAEEREIAFAEGIEQGIERGIEQGIEQGSHQKALETAAAFKRLGFDIAKIAEGTGLSIQEVKSL
ncbi:MULTISPECIES: Rpn family recombination-promoting nuclease/putative transposase [unclassified Treponema]|uniref:Rpn family recombination-promoting nuclease/putative transposase n=1 Tax=unclassified Treponema TaxID=2638727 RepID=UPI0020A2E6C6|nr:MULTISPECIES: Rpn family recombination-promoting nuclease/putative transposase [unclassified Treponema]UTC67681.1 Rpn family recombination-promoting nuclease/putative transposase [Treponema sp. OMZ 789]UTC70409.1 Rpn family recombination-promoting nuclease/putative transposase [Treponema sp. OMZ 790]UTC73123.1 Rpn family recombination-promoting nuclease/putative transposase [Treponema sp. OMZ 791]